MSKQTDGEIAELELRDNLVEPMSQLESDIRRTAINEFQEKRKAFADNVMRIILTWHNRQLEQAVKRAEIDAKKEIVEQFRLCYATIIATEVINLPKEIMEAGRFKYNRIIRVEGVDFKFTGIQLTQSTPEEEK